MAKKTPKKAQRNYLDFDEIQIEREKGLKFYVESLIEASEEELGQGGLDLNLRRQVLEYVSLL
jgi:hypothetical protein